MSKQETLMTIRSPEHQTFKEFARIWDYRFLLKSLVWRELKSRYRNTTMGVAWFVLQPLAFMIVISAGLRFAFPGDLGGLPYPVYVASGLVLWTYFANGFPAGANSLQTYQSMINKVAFPHACLPLVPSISAVVDMFAASLLLIPLIILFDLALSWRIFLLPIILFGTGLFIFGLALFFAGVASRYKDIRHLVPFLTMLMFFASPVFISGDYNQGKLGWFFLANPFVTFINSFRWAIFEHYPQPPLIAFIAATFGTLSILVVGIFVFQRQQANVADML